MRCKQCGTVFPPNPKTTGSWVCATCQTKNPNLKRHYRSVADLCILGLVFALIFLAIRISQSQFGLSDVFIAADAVLLLAAIVVIYRAQTPWIDRTVHRLIWIVFGVAFGANVLFPLLVSGRVNFPPAVVYVTVFSYLFWLSAVVQTLSIRNKPYYQASEVS
jgi:hypothetical protein